MLKLLFRHYRARARLKARQERGRAMYKEMAETWETKRHWTEKLHWTKSKEPAGTCIIVGEENMLGARRIRIVENHYTPQPGVSSEDRLKDSTNWAEAVLWKERLENGDDEQG